MSIPLPPKHLAPNQYHDRHQFAPVKLEVIEMRPRDGFIRLPQDSPIIQPSRNHQMESTISNGVAMHHVPNFNNPPGYTRHSSANPKSLPFSHHNHNYEELPYPRETTTDDVFLEEGRGGVDDGGDGGDFQRQGSHTEVDQYFNPSPVVHSISSTPLTATDTTGKKPRKKVNPIYDQYQGPLDKITTSKDSALNHPVKPPKKGSFPGKCLRHPATTVFIFLLVLLVMVALVLIMLGTIETPGSVGAQAGKQVGSQTTARLIEYPPTSPYPSETDLLAMIQEQGRLILSLQERILTLESVLGGGNEINASLSTKVAMNSFKLDTMEVTVKAAAANITVLNLRVDDVQQSLSNTLGSLVLTQSRTLVLENKTRQLEVNVGQLSAKAVTQSNDILTNMEQNDIQKNEILTIRNDLSVAEQRFAVSLADINRTIHVELDTISKMDGPRGYNGTEGPPGPPGPQGAGDLTQCAHRMVTDTSSYSTNTEGFWQAVPSDKIFTGVACTTEGGTLAFLDSEILNGTPRYRCLCAGRSTDLTSDTRKCRLHYWQCPANS